MKKLCYLILVLTLALAGCKTQQIPATLPPVILNNSDSVKVETITITKLDTVTVYVEVPAQSAERHTASGNSHLETDFAESDAWINDDGSLSHNLKNKPQSMATDVTVPNTSRETNTDNVSIKEIPVEVPKPVEVERDFTLWESFRLKAFWFLFIISLAGVSWILRKPLISAIKKLC